MSVEFPGKRKFRHKISKRLHDLRKLEMYMARLTEELVISIHPSGLACTLAAAIVIRSRMPSPMSKDIKGPQMHPQPSIHPRVSFKRFNAKKLRKQFQKLSQFGNFYVRQPI